METIYRVTAVCLGVPPSEFVWEFYDKSKKWQRVGPISPVAFYQEQVRPHFDVEEKVGNGKSMIIFFFCLGLGCQNHWLLGQ